VQHPKLGPKPHRHSPANEILQREEPIGTGEGVQNGRGIASDVLVDVRAAQGDDERPVRIKGAKPADALGATPGVQRNHQIGWRSVVCIGDADLMT
jgi:hypothetical protein